jgi:hypothetical protein
VTVERGVQDGGVEVVGVVVGDEHGRRGADEFRGFGRVRPRVEHEGGAVLGEDHGGMGVFREFHGDLGRAMAQTTRWV